jgi:hypothetical protein
MKAICRQQREKDNDPVDPGTVKKFGKDVPPELGQTISERRKKMKNKTMVLGGILLLVVIAMAAQPPKARARTNVSVGVDLGGVVMGVNTYPYYEYGYIPPPPPVYYPRYRYYPPPPPVYYRDYRGERYHPRHHHRPHGRDGYRYR